MALNYFNFLWLTRCDMLNFIEYDTTKKQTDSLSSGFNFNNE